MKRKMEVRFGKDKLIFKLDELVDLIEKEFGRKNQGTRIIVQIERVRGGFKLITDLNTEDEREHVFQDDCSSEQRAFVQLIFKLIEYFGLLGSRYSAERIHVQLKPGDKYIKPKYAK